RSRDPSGRVWVVGAIDGTANFARGIQVWATLLGLQVDGHGVLGVASAPALDERYVAVAGESATLNGSPIRVSGVAELSDAQLVLQEFRELLTGPRREAGAGLLRDARRFRGVGAS